MPDLPGPVWAAIILYMTGWWAVDSAKTKWHYRHSPTLGCHESVKNHPETTLCYSDERTYTLYFEPYLWMER